MTKKEYSFWLSNIEGIGGKTIELLLDYFKQPEYIYKAKKSDFKMLERIREKQIEALLCSRDETRIKKEYEQLEKSQIKFLTWEDAAYPEKLKCIYNPPYSLFWKGQLPKEERITIAIVGARNCSEYGRELAQYFARELSDAGIQVVSGLASGIDGAAHRGASKGNTPTFAILGTGVDICYPREHFSLYMELQRQGGIISEYGMGVGAKAFHFPMRNRIISGLSDGILVVEAKEKSGSLITADLGLEQGKDIFAIPGRVGDIRSEGCNNLIRMGAELVTNPQEMINNFHIQSTIIGKEMKKNNKLLDSKEKIVYAKLSLVPKHLDEILGEAGMLMSEVMGILINLELKGYIKQTTRNYYVCCL